MSRVMTLLPLCAVVFLAACAAPSAPGECVLLPREVAYWHQPEGGSVLYCNATGVPQYLIDRAASGRY